MKLRGSTGGSLEGRDTETGRLFLGCSIFNAGLLAKVQDEGAVEGGASRSVGAMDLQSRFRRQIKKTVKPAGMWTPQPKTTAKPSGGKKRSPKGRSQEDCQNVKIQF